MKYQFRNDLLREMAPCTPSGRRPPQARHVSHCPRLTAYGRFPISRPEPSEATIRRATRHTWRLIARFALSLPTEWATLDSAKGPAAWAILAAMRRASSLVSGLREVCLLGHGSDELLCFRSFSAGPSSHYPSVLTSLGEDAPVAQAPSQAAAATQQGTARS
jgi:hypothetical protein